MTLLEDGVGVVGELTRNNEASCRLIDAMALVRMSGKGASNTFGQYGDHLLHYHLFDFQPSFGHKD